MRLVEDAGADRVGEVRIGNTVGRCSCRSAGREPAVTRRRWTLFRSRHLRLLARRLEGHLASRGYSFSLTAYIDAWGDDGGRFVFGYDAVKSMVGRAESLEVEEDDEPVRAADATFEGTAREAARSDRPRGGDLNMRVEREHVADFEHKPTEAKRGYRIVVHHGA